MFSRGCERSLSSGGEGFASDSRGPRGKRPFIFLVLINPVWQIWQDGCWPLPCWRRWGLVAGDLIDGLAR
jgi:hypothetical protein